ncbi:assimilatory nitrite reductase (NAD(P)H) small subunit [Sanguibacter gelidistatuariae]|uniref:Assimilatory nitrite reductase (NAD(P)H) small subunit n=1 Tax=Sanguibacter gelidistatuariae TaxID=1814289 RepID=A0A1G6J6W0_9MICO|nr:nitrite reductase small subunit NirD [Sanguibacter gelidistatuariae]SDC13656.1 assimilatory nitrite reductase (NAD(P)H) small subunit [Sanguibacter gelidistatuariae]
MTSWTAVCAMDDLLPELGAGAMVDGVQVALFRLADDRVLAIHQRDPYSGANVLSRGIIGSRGDVATVTSPMYKQVWNLATGECLDPVGKDPVDLRTCAVEVTGGQVRVSLG